MLRVYVYNVTPEELALIEKILIAEGFNTSRITDLCSFTPEYNDGDEVITFGQRARSWCVTHELPHLSLPTAQQLLPQIGQHELRHTTHARLVSFRKILDLKKKKELERQESSIVADATGLTAEGFPIKFSNNPDKRAEDISMTYRELDLMNLAVGVLGIRNFSFVRDNNDSSESTD